MSASLDQRYFDWLYGQVCSVKAKTPSKTHRKLIHILYTKEFVWLVPNDDNRVEDGKDLRMEFFEDEGIRMTDRDVIWLDLGCSMLEFLIALARRYSFEVNRPAEVLFWEILQNLDLHKLNDSKYINRDEVEEVLDRVIWRAYNYNGGGGLFPLVRPEEDQRTVEVWYQLSAYILEREMA